MESDSNSELLRRDAAFCCHRCRERGVNRRPGTKNNFIFQAAGAPVGRVDRRHLAQQGGPLVAADPLHSRSIAAAVAGLLAGAHGGRACTWAGGGGRAGGRAV